MTVSTSEDESRRGPPNVRSTSEIAKPVWVSENGKETWIAFPKSVQVSCVGNSVSPPVAEALVGANCSHLIATQVAA